MFLYEMNTLMRLAENCRMLDERETTNL